MPSRAQAVQLELQESEIPIRSFFPVYKVGVRGLHRQTLNSPPPIDATNLYLLLEQLPLRENWKLDKKNPIKRDSPNWGARGRNSFLERENATVATHSASSPAGSNPKVHSLPWRSGRPQQRSVTAISIFWTQHNLDKCHNIWSFWLLTTKGNTPRKAVGYKVGRKKPLLLKGPHINSPILKSNQKSPERKVLSPLVKKDSLDRLWSRLIKKWDLPQPRLGPSSQGLRLCSSHCCELV